MFSIVSNAVCVGFSGSRSPSPASLSALSVVSKKVSANAKIIIGCAKGIDAEAKKFFPDAKIFSVESGKFGAGKSAFARRSVACVNEVKKLNGVWISFPSGSCPVGLSPNSSSSKCFSGTGSGTWASLAFAVGSGVPCLCWLPAGIVAPSWLAAAGGGWWLAAPAPVQLSLF
jgi:hypothetical protein